MFMRPYRGRTRPTRELDALRREMNRLFNEWPAWSGWSRAPSYPAINLWTEDDSAIVTAEIPGIGVGDIEVAVEDDTLSLRGKRQADELEEGATYHRQERRYGTFDRQFRLPFRVDAEKVDAGFRNGVLTITLPRAEADKPRKIAVKTG